MIPRDGFCVRLCTAFAYVYRFCVHLCTSFAHVLRILRTYTDYILHKLYGFLCTLSGFAYVYSLTFSMFNVDRLEGSNISGSLICFVHANARDLLTLLRIRYWGFCRVLFTRELLVTIGPSRGSDLAGSVESFVHASCPLLLDRLKYPIFRVPSSSLSNNMLVIHRSILPWRFLVDLDRAIDLSRWSNITVHYADLW